jgi:hypothetical protein
MSTSSSRITFLEMVVPRTGELPPLLMLIPTRAGVAAVAGLIVLVTSAAGLGCFAVRAKTANGRFVSIQSAKDSSRYSQLQGWAGES